MLIYSDSEWAMVAEHEGLIKAVIAREKQHILALHLPLLEFDDLFSIGKFGMIRAIHAHKADRGALSTVCSHAISNEITNEVKRQFRASREPKRRALSIDKIHEDGCRTLEAQLYHERMSVEDIAEAHRTFDIALELCKHGILRASDAKAWAAYMHGSTHASIGKAMGLTPERIRQKVERANTIIRDYVNGKNSEHWQKAVSAGKYAMYAGRAIMLDKCSPEKVCGKWRFTARKNEIEPLDKNMRYDLDKMMRNAILYKDGNVYRVSWLGIRWLERITGLEIVEKKNVAKK